MSLLSRCISRPRLTFGLVSLLLAALIAACSESTQVSLAQPPPIGSCPIFPADNIWNVPVTNLPVDPNSNAYVSSIGANTGLHPDFGSGMWQGAPIGIPYVVVPASQPTVTIGWLYSYSSGESDPGPYPIPPNAPIEGGPSSTGDRHVIVVQQSSPTTSCELYETWDSHPVGGGTSWNVGSGAKFNLTGPNAYDLRTAGLTSADAAGLPILPGLARFEEVNPPGATINHALRFTVVHSRNTYVWPARHQASSSSNPAYPPMGQRFRLKASYVIPSNYSPQTKAILQALKTYGMIVADNGSNWYLSGIPDAGWDDNSLVPQLSAVKGLNFEAVDSSSLMINPNSSQAAVAPTSAPTTLAASVISSSRIDLSWTENSINETGFSIERSTGPNGIFTQVGTAAADATSFSNTGLADGVTYYYRVRAYNPYGTSAYSNSANGTTPFIAPTGLTATPFSPSQINLTWNDNSTGRTAYYVERKTGVGGTFAVIGTAGANSYQDTNLLDATDYYYRVQAFNSFGTSAYANSPKATTPLAVPTDLLAWASAANQVTVQWTDNSRSEEGYTVERSLSNLFTSPVSFTTAPNVTSYTDMGLTTGTTYYYRVKTHKTPTDSGYSNTASAITTIWQVSVSPDDGTGGTLNTLSRALLPGNASAGQTILITTNLAFTNGLVWNPIIPAGVNIVGGCDINGPTITIDGTGTAPPTAGLVLNHTNLVGLKVMHFPGVPQVKATATANKVVCTKLQK